jgi:hypothetical protein
MSRLLIEKDIDAYNYLLVDEGMGNLNLPDRHPNHKYHIEVTKMGRIYASMSITYGAVSHWTPKTVKDTCNKLLAEFYNKYYKQEIK